MLNPKIIKFTDKSLRSNWTMFLDLDQINHDLGRRELDAMSRCYYTVYPIKAFRKLCRYLFKYADAAGLVRATSFIFENYKDSLWKYWESEGIRCHFIIKTDSLISEKPSEDPQHSTSS